MLRQQGVKSEDISQWPELEIFAFVYLDLNQVV